jgi:hypothetical protein
MTNLSGALAEDALGLWTTLQKLYSSRELTYVSRWYTSAWEESACEEPMVVRTPGASFNPRPARLARLLLEAGPPPSKELLAGACLLVSRMENTRLPSELRPTIEAVRNFRASGQLPELDVPGARSDATLLAFVMVLDDVRHTHMLQDGPTKLSWWKTVAPLAESLMSSSELTEKHRQQLATALRLQQRNMRSTEDLET